MLMATNHLFALSPLDGRYQSKTEDLRDYLSEASLINSRLIVELTYLETLSEFDVIRSLNQKEKKLLD